MMDDLLGKEHNGVMKRRAEDRSARVESLAARDLPYGRTLKKNSQLIIPIKKFKEIGRKFKVLFTKGQLKIAPLIITQQDA